VREDADVDLTATLEVAAHRNATRLDLVRLDPGRFHGHEAVVTEGHVVAALGGARHAAAHLLAVLDAFRKQHAQPRSLRARARSSRPAGLPPGPSRRRACGRRRFFLSSSCFGRGSTAARRCRSPTISPWKTQALTPMTP